MAAASAQNGARAATPEAPALVKVWADPGDGAGVVQAHVDINATPETVWKIMVDCDQVPNLMVNVKYCRVLKRGPGGQWDLREQVTKASLLPGVRTVIRSDYDEPRTVEFHRVDGDFKILEGEWRLEPLEGGARTRVYYQSRISTPFGAPGVIVRPLMRSALKHSLEKLREVSEASAAAQP